MITIHETNEVVQSRSAKQARVQTEERKQGMIRDSNNLANDRDIKADQTKVNYLVRSSDLQ